MNINLVTILVITTIAVGLFYVFTLDTVVHNHGEVEANIDNDEPSLPKFKPSTDDTRNNIENHYDPQNPNIVRGSQMNPIKQNTDVLPYPQISNNYTAQPADIQGQFDINTGNQPKMSCFPKDTITPQDLMPREDSNNAWQVSNPPVNGHLSDRNFLESGYHYGIDTVSNTLKNPNLQLRSDPIIPQIQVGPWSQSSYGPDTNHRQLEIGGDY